jgi:CRP-like cAMP-binding protein
MGKEPNVPPAISAVSGHATHAELRRLKLFSGLSDGDMDCIVALTTPLEVRAGTELCRQGEVGRQFMIIERGEAQVSVDGINIAVLRAGDFFGEIALLDGGTRVATVRAIKPMRLHVATAGEFHMLLMSVPSLTRQILTTTAVRLRRVLERQLRHAPDVSRRQPFSKSWQPLF